jgi:hypothetical protein
MWSEASSASRPFKTAESAAEASYAVFPMLMTCSAMPLVVPGLDKHVVRDGSGGRPNDYIEVLPSGERCHIVTTLQWSSILPNRSKRYTDLSPFFRLRLIHR